MNQDLETGDTPVKAGETAFMGQDDRGAHTTTASQATTDAAGQEERGSDTGLVDRRAASEFVSQAPAASMEDGRITVGVPVFDASGETIGNVAAYDEAAGRLVVRKGWLFTEDMKFPIDAIGDKGSNGIFLSQTKDELQQQYRDRTIVSAASGGGGAGSGTMDQATEASAAPMDQTTMERGAEGGDMRSRGGDMSMAGTAPAGAAQTARDTGRTERSDGGERVTYRAVPGGGLDVEEGAQDSVGGDDTGPTVNRTDPLTTDG